MKQKSYIVVWFIVAAVGLFGCQTMQYHVGNEIFSNKEQALQQKDRELADCLAAIPVTQTPIHGTAVVVIPTPDVVRQRGVKTWGTLTADQMREMVDFHAQGITKEMEFMYRAIETRRIFDRLSLNRSPEPREVECGSNDVVVFFDLASYEQRQWYVRAKNWDKPRPLFMDASKPVGASRMIAWLDYLEEQLRSATKK
jgi:hypothetical protein